MRTLALVPNLHNPISEIKRLIFIFVKCISKETWSRLKGTWIETGNVSQFIFYGKLLNGGMILCLRPPIQ